MYRVIIVSVDEVTMCNINLIDVCTMHFLAIDLVSSLNDFFVFVCFVFFLIYASMCLFESLMLAVVNDVGVELGCVFAFYVGLMCCNCMLVGWRHGSYEGLQIWRNRLRSPVSERVSRRRRFSKHGKGDSEIAAVW